MLKTAFPGSVSANVSGGDPSAIPEMSWEALKSYHQQFYHPSNCIAFLYGEFQDFNAFLKLLDEAFPHMKNATVPSMTVALHLSEGIQSSSFPIRWKPKLIRRTARTYTIFSCAPA